MVITANTTGQVPLPHQNLVLRSVTLTSGGVALYKHNTLYPILQGRVLLSQSHKNIASALQDALRIYYQICTPVRTIFRWTPATSELDLKICTDTVTFSPRVVFRFGTATSAEGNWILELQTQMANQCVIGPYAYEATCKGIKYGK